MKDCGIEWIGQIPDDWEVKRFKYCVEICNGRDYKDIEVDEGGFPVLGSGGEFARAKKYSYDKPSVLLGRKGTIDKPIYYDKPFWTVDTMFYTKISEYMNPRFTYYLATLIRFDYYSTQTALPSMTQTDLGSEKLPVPNITEQKLIADFLDKQTAKIDAIIKTNEEQLEVLKKYKKSLITQTVTKGLNKNARMKDSGIEWIGKIPEEWEVSKIKYEVSQTGSGTTPDSGYLPYYENGTNNWIQSGDLYQKDYIRETETKITDLAVRSSKSLRFYTKNFIVIAMYGASVGNISLSLIDAYTNQACCTIKNNNENSLKYMFYYLQMCHEHLLTLAVGGGQPNISQVILKNLEFIKPKLNDQIEIANFLDEKLTKIEPIISQKQQAIETMQKYKKSLIYEYVTGKKRIK